MAFPAMGIEAVAKDVASFERSLDKMKRSIGGVGQAASDSETHISRFNRAIGNIAVHGFAGIAIGTAAFMALATAAAYAGVQIAKVITDMTIEAARVQEMGVVLEILGQRAGWSTDEINKQVEAIKNLGIRTDVAQSLLAQFARYQMDAADATKLARVAQDAAVLSMKDSSEALDDILHGVLTQNSLVLRNAGLNVDVQGSLDVYAKSIGKVVGNLTEQERIQAVLNGVLEEGTRIAGVYEKAMEEPGKRMRSLERYFYEARVEIGKYFLPIFGKVIDRIGNFVKGIQASLAEGQPLNIFFSKLSDYASNIIDLLDPFTILIDLFLQGKTNSIAFYAYLQSIFGGELGADIWKLVNAVDALVGALLIGDWSSIQEMVPQWVVDIWNDLNTAWGNIVAAWDEKLKPALEGLGAWWSENSEDIIAGASGIAGELGKIASSAITDGMDLLAEAIQKITSWLTDHKQDIKDGLGTIEKFVVNHGDQIKDFFKVVAAISLAQLALDLVGVGVGLAAVAAPYIALGAVAAALAVIYDTGEKAAQRSMTDEDWEKLAPSEKAVASIKASFEEIGKAISGTAEEGVGKDLNDAGLSLGDQIAQGIITGIITPLQETSLGAIILDALGKGLSAMNTGDLSGLILGPVTFWSSLASGMANALAEELGKVDWLATFTQWADIGAAFVGNLINAIVMDLINGASDYVSLIIAAMTYIWDQLTNEFSTEVQSFVDLGEAIIDGIIKGLDNAWGRLKAKITEIINSIPDWAKDILDIGSPSKVFEKIGKNMMLGLEEGTGEKGPASAIKKNIGTVTMPPVASQTSTNRTQNVTNEKNILAGATINNNTGFDLDAFAETVRNS